MSLDTSNQLNNTFLGIYEKRVEFDDYGIGCNFAQKLEQQLGVPGKDEVKLRLN